MFSAGVPASSPPVRFLAVMGEHDGGGLLLGEEGRAILACGAPVVGLDGLGDGVDGLVMASGDHSLRHRPPKDPQKDKYSTTSETQRCNEAIADAVSKFVSRL
jgi:hypothetical protein